MSACNLVGDGDLDAPLDDVEAAAELFANAGLCVFLEMLPVSVVDDAHAKFQVVAKEIDAGLVACEVDLGTQFRFNEVVRRRTARFDIKTTTALLHPLLHTDAPWLPFIEQVLGEGYTECWRGVVDNRPGSEVQGWHRDGQPLFDHLHLPAHCIVVFVPLIDVVTDALGPTQFFPGSHATFRSHLYAGLPEGRCDKPYCTPLLSRGSILCFDYRTLHRGLPNSTSTARPLLYVIYAKPWFAISESEGAFPTDRPLFSTGHRARDARGGADRS